MHIRANTKVMTLRTKILFLKKVSSQRKIFLLKRILAQTRTPYRIKILLRREYLYPIKILCQTKILAQTRTQYRMKILLRRKYLHQIKILFQTKILFVWTLCRLDICMQNLPNKIVCMSLNSLIILNQWFSFLSELYRLVTVDCRLSFIGVPATLFFKGMVDGRNFFQ